MGRTRTHSANAAMAFRWVVAYSGRMAFLSRMALGENSSDTSEKSFGVSGAISHSPSPSTILWDLQLKCTNFHYLCDLYEALKIDKTIHAE
jgi:hypothetical protein